jgi:hypothetical protein
MAPHRSCIVAPAGATAGLLLWNPARPKEKRGCTPRATAGVLVVRGSGSAADFAETSGLSQPLAASWQAPRRGFGDEQVAPALGLIRLLRCRCDTQLGASRDDRSSVAEDVLDEEERISGLVEVAAFCIEHVRELGPSL